MRIKINNTQKCKTLHCVSFGVAGFELSGATTPAAISPKSKEAQIKTSDFSGPQKLDSQQRANILNLDF